MEPIVKTVNLKKHFNTRDGLLHAVDGVDIEIQKGKTLGVVGESGCGKSTLGRLVLRLLEATSGEVFFEGEDILKYRRSDIKEFRRRASFIFQDPYSSLDPRMSVFDLIADPMKMNRTYKNDAELSGRVFELMNTVGLSERFVSAYPHEMDGGRRQRVGVARALALNPKFVVCDEPVSALDVSVQAQILNLLMDLQENLGLTYMFITHNLSVVKHISDEIAVMYLGQCIERADKRELFKNPLHPYTKALLASIPVPRLSSRARKHIIRGEVSNPVNPSAGCRFAPRCDCCRPDCTGEELTLKDRGGGHYVACRLFE